LIITNLEYWSPSSVTPEIGNYIGYKITIKNIGNASLQGTYKEEAYYDDDYLRLEGGISVPVNPGETFTTTQYAYKKITSSGEHTIKVVIDTENSIHEINENNNERTETFQVPTQDQEDLVSGTLSVDKTSVKTGENITLTITAQDDQELNRVGAYYQGSWHYKYCTGAESCTKTWTFSESTVGNKYYYGKVYGYKTDQSSETVNTKPYFAKVVVVAPVENKSDIIISSIISQPTLPTTNDKINFRATIKNRGSQKMPYVSGGIITKISSDSLPSPGWRICDAMTTRLDSGQTAVIDCPIFQTLPVGSHKFTFSTDDENRLSESNENNNARSFYLTTGSTVREDTVSGTLSIDKTTVKVGENIKLTVMGQDDNGLSKLWAYYHNSWHSDYADGTSYNKTWTFSESSPGTYVYKGYVYGEKIDGSTEYVWTNPSSVTVVVIETTTADATCSDSDGGKNYYIKGSATPSSSAIDGRVDCCKLSYSTYMGDSVNHIGPGGGACVTSGSYLYEAICGTDGNPTTIVYQCPNGCENGVCISATTEAKKENLSSMLASIQAAIDNLIKQLQELKK